jgi:hypothetical protein
MRGCGVCGIKSAPPQICVRANRHQPTNTCNSHAKEPGFDPANTANPANRHQIRHNSPTSSFAAAISCERALGDRQRRECSCISQRAFELDLHSSPSP